MTLGEFLAARLGRILLFFAGGAAGALFLAATGTQTGVLLLLALVILPAFLGVQASDFLRQRNRIRELEEILEGLDQAYLFSECASPARDPFERRLMHLTGRACRAMTGAVSQARSAQRAYQEYVERWVHEIKTPITAAGLLCRRLDAEAAPWPTSWGRSRPMWSGPSSAPGRRARSRTASCAAPAWRSSPPRPLRTTGPF